MSYEFSEPILSEDFISEILSEISNEVLYCQEDQPDYAVFSAAKERWYQTMEQLDHSVLEEYDNLVLQAFADYQRALENNMAVRGIISVFAQRLHGTEHPDSGDGSAAQAALTQACGAFIRRLTGETAAQCSAYLRLRKEIIDAGGPLCRQCGVELAEGLLDAAGI